MKNKLNKDKRCEVCINNNHSYCSVCRDEVEAEKIANSYMFQYHHDEGVGVIIEEDTGIITKDEAVALWKKYYPKVARQLREGLQPQMAIWQNCKNETDYEDDLVWVDYRDCEEVNGHIYKKTRVPDTL